jgi:hypothetical protein
MTDQLEQLFRDLRTDTVPTIIPPGADAARATVRRRREVRAAAGSVLAVAVVAIGIGTVQGHDGGGSAASPGGPSSGPVSGLVSGPASGPPELIPTPADPGADSRFQAVNNALGDPNQHPWVMATAAMLQGGDYENDINDIGAGKYRLLVYCAGTGRLSVQIKADQYGNKVLATGTVPCHEKPVATRIAVTQPHTGYLRLFAHAENGADNAALSFKFERAD